MADVKLVIPGACPKCGGEIAGGAGWSGEVIPDGRRVFFSCGASLTSNGRSLGGENLENPFVRFKGCPELANEAIVEDEADFCVRFGLEQMRA